LENCYRAATPARFARLAKSAGVERWIEQLGPGCVLLRQFIVQNRIEQQLVDSNASVVIDVAELSETIMKKLTRERVVPIISARLSCVIVG